MVASRPPSSPGCLWYEVRSGHPRPPESPARPRTGDRRPAWLGLRALVPGRSYGHSHASRPPMRYACRSDGRGLLPRNSVKKRPAAVPVPTAPSRPRRCCGVAERPCIFWRRWSPDIRTLRQGKAPLHGTTAVGQYRDVVRAGVTVHPPARKGPGRGQGRRQIIGRWGCAAAMSAALRPCRS